MVKFVLACEFCKRFLDSKKARHGQLVQENIGLYCEHNFFDKTLLDNIMIQNYKLITILRDPVKRKLSDWTSHEKYNRKGEIDKYIMTTKYTFDTLHTMTIILATHFVSIACLNRWDWIARTSTTDPKWCRKSRKLISSSTWCLFWKKCQSPSFY